MHGGEPCTQHIKQQMIDWLGPILVEYYGMTEGGGTCILEAHNFPDKLHTVGKPSPMSDVRIIDEQGKELPRGEIGEVVGSQQVMMTGYYKKLAAGEGRSDALRDVQLAIHANAKYAHPYFWASFVAAGDSGPL